MMKIQLFTPGPISVVAGDPHEYNTREGHEMIEQGENP